ncbi:RNA polymerase sigma factor [compost metagenome]
MMSGDVTQWLHRWRRGDPQAQAHLFDLIYPALREMAVARIGQRQADVTLRPTSLMHEALLRVMGSDVEFVDRAHFLALAALKMRAVLVDFARSGAAAKRGAGAWNLTLSHADQNVPYAPTCDYEVLALHQALNQLAGHDERAARAVEYMYFGGMDRQEIAVVLEVSVPTVDRDLRFAKAWLNQRLA